MEAIRGLTVRVGQGGRLVVVQCAHRAAMLVLQLPRGLLAFNACRTLPAPLQQGIKEATLRLPDSAPNGFAGRELRVAVASGALPRIPCICCGCLNSLATLSVQDSNYVFNCLSPGLPATLDAPPHRHRPRAPPAAAHARGHRAALRLCGGALVWEAQFECLCVRLSLRCWGSRRLGWPGSCPEALSTVHWVGAFIFFIET